MLPLLPHTAETTALGAAYAAGLAVGLWSDTGELAQHWRIADRFTPKMDAAERNRRAISWHKAVKRSLGWVE